MAAAKRRSAASICSGSSSRNNQLKVSWLGVCGGRQIDDRGQFRPVGLGEVGDVDAAFRATQGRRQSEEQQRGELVLSRVIAGVVDRGEDIKNGVHVRCQLTRGPVSESSIL
jgi:hypothetical protein